jgi:hypothetical protein
METRDLAAENTAKTPKIARNWSSWARNGLSRHPASGARLGQSLLQVSDEVLGVLKSNGNSHRAGAYVGAF